MPQKPVIRGNSAKLRTGRVSEAYGVYSVTKVVDHRRPLLQNDLAASLVIDSLRHLRKQDRIKLYAFCVMPDHLHLAFCLMPAEELSRLISSFSKFTSRRLNKLLSQTTPFWQEGFHDRHCRSPDELSEICEYIEQNPVRVGLVSVAADWPFSSAAPLRKDVLDREWWP